MYPVVTAQLGWLARRTQHMLLSAASKRVSCAEQTRVHQASQKFHVGARAHEAHRMNTAHRVGLQPASIALRYLACSVRLPDDLWWSPLGRAPSISVESHPRVA